MKIALAQIEVVPGNPNTNFKKIRDAVEKASYDKIDLIAFPEACISGYFVGDLWERNSFLIDCDIVEQKVIQLSAEFDIVIVFGSITTSIDMYFETSKNGEDGRLKKINSVIIAQRGKVVKKRAKFSQPNYREFEDDRHFYSGRDLALDYLKNNKSDYLKAKELIKSYIEIYHAPVSIEIKNKWHKIGVMLCEDGWDDDYSISPYSFFQDKADFIINCSCSPFTQGKGNRRDILFSKNAKKYNTAIFYVNNVGVQNTGKNVFTFDGGSTVYSGYRLLGCQTNYFEEGISLFELDDDYDVKNLKSIVEKKSEVEILHKALTYGTQKFCEMLGLNKIVIGASGGLDSALNAAIYSQFIKPENLYLVNMPSKYNSDLTKNAAKELADNIGCNYLVFPIEEHVNNLTASLESCLNAPVSSFNNENVQARFRSSSVLAGIASVVGGVFTCNANKSETVVGYSTLYGDGSGFFANLADLWKGSDIYELANYHNNNIKNIIPSESINIKPSAELSDKQNIEQGDGDPFYYPYHDCLFKYWVEKWQRGNIKELINMYGNPILEKEINYKDDKSIYELFPTQELFVSDLKKWWKLYNGLAVAKRIQGPPVLTLSRRAVSGTDLREVQLQKIRNKK